MLITWVNKQADKIRNLIEPLDLSVWAYLVMTVICGLAINQGDTTLAGPGVRKILTVLVLLSLMVAWGTQVLFFKKHQLTWIVLIPIVYWLVTRLNAHTAVSSGVIALAQFVGFLFLEKDKRRKVFIYYKKFLAVMALLGAVTYILHYLHVSLPHQVVDYYNSIPGAKYINYYTCFIYNKEIPLRLCGWFNEPGYFGTVVALALCADHIDLKKVENWFLLIGGALSFSVAFFAILAIYVVLKNCKKPWFLGLLAVAAVFYFLILPHIEFGIRWLDKLVARFVFKNGSLGGDNRSNAQVDAILMQVLGSKNWLLGNGGGYSSTVFERALTFKIFLIDYGVLGFVLLFGSHLAAAIYCAKKNWKAICLYICFFLSVYQRPNIFVLLYYVVLFGGIENLRYEPAADEIAVPGKTGKLLRAGWRFIADPGYRFLFCAERGWLNNMPDETYLKKKFKIKMGQELDLEDPRTYNEKLQWLKIHDRKKEYTRMADKYRAKAFAAERIGKEHVIPNLGVWSHFDQIDFDALPEQFVLKCTHDSGGVVICRDKKKLNKDAARRKIEKSLKKNYYYSGREWPYKRIRPRIIAEKYLESNNGQLQDYKFFCFDGKAKLLFIATDRQTEGEETKFDFFDMEFHHLDLQNGHPNAAECPEKPECFEQMRQMAETLSQGIPHVRVDFYQVDGKVYFGEMTFFHWSGMMPFEPKEWDEILGSWISLPQKRN